MKKIITSIAAVAMALTLSISAFALPSPTVSGFVKGIRSAIDANGNAVQIEMQTIADAQSNLSDAEKTAMDQIKKQKNLRSIMGSHWEDGMQLADLRYIRIKGDASSVKYPITITFNVPGITKNSKVTLLVYNVATGSWELVTCTAGDGTITGTFNVLGLVAFVVDTDTAKTLESAVTSPKTGESNFPICAGIATAAVLGGAILWTYKKGNKTA